jgi:hypothetical protein
MAGKDKARIRSIQGHDKEIGKEEGERWMY